MKYLFWLAMFCFVVAWTIYFFTHMETLCSMWWFAADDWCIRYNTVNR